MAMWLLAEFLTTKPSFRIQPPADGRPFYLVKNSLSSLIKEVEGSRTVLKVILRDPLRILSSFQ